MLDTQTVGPASELAATNAARYPNESAYRGGHLRSDLFLEPFGTQSLSVLPGARIRGRFPVLIVDRDQERIGFDGEFGADVAAWQAVPVTIEGQADIFVHRCLGRVAVSGNERR